MDECSVRSGYFVEKAFARVCQEYLADLKRYRPDLLNTGSYPTPRTDIPPEQMPKQYRGLQRDPLETWIELFRNTGVVEPTGQELEASLLMGRLDEAGKEDCNIILDLEDARDVMRKIKPPVTRELIWARCMDSTDTPPAGAVLLGYEPSAFYYPCWSAIAEAMFFHEEFIPNDKEGLRFKAYHDKLNRWGLFDTPADAEDYVKGFRASLPVDQQEDWFYIVEVWEAY